MGILLVAWRLGPSDGLARDLRARVRANVANEADEVMWGTAGTPLAARAMLEWTRDEDWRELWREGADALLARRDAEGWWTQRMYGQFRGLGPPHGLVGNVQALQPLLDPRGAPHGDGVCRGRAGELALPRAARARPAQTARSASSDAAGRPGSSRLPRATSTASCALRRGLP